MKLSIVFAIAIMFVAATRHDSHAESKFPGGACNASGLFGAFGCSIGCPEGKNAICEGGLFSATCKCVPEDNGADPNKPIPNIMPHQIEASIEFSAWARNTGSPTLANLAEFVDNARSSAESHNPIAFWNAEHDGGIALRQLPPVERGLVANWRTEHGFNN